MATRDATMQTYLVLKGRPIAQTWVKARELSALGRADSHSVGKPYPPDTVCVCVHVCVCVCVCVSQASPSLSSLLRGYIRNVKLHQTISAQHPHESQPEGERGG